MNKKFVVLVLDSSFRLHPSSLLVMIRSRILTVALVAGFAATVVSGLAANVPAQSRKAARHRAGAKSICGDAALPCKTSVTFAPHDLPFRVPKDAVIYDTELFYAIILKSVGQSEDDCNVFVAENERLAVQTLFPRNKVFASRCPEPPDEILFYSNISSKHRIMALYAGSTLVEAKRLLEKVKATGKFPGANIRRMRTGFNGT